MSRQRRRFVGKVRIVTEQRRREFAEAGFPLVPEDQLLVLEDYLDISRRRSLNLLPMFKLQLHMFQDLVIAEKAIGSYKQKMKEMSGETTSAGEDVDSEPKPDEKAATESTPAGGDESSPHRAEIQAIKRELFFLRSEVRSLRDIADGMAWRLFDYDRAILHELARRPAGKHINPEGLLAELYTFASYINERSGVAVLNDLTHFLKFGDVTIRRGSSEFEIVEVKAGASGGAHVRRQRQGLNEIVSLLSKDQGRAVDGEPVKISAVDIVPEMFVGNLRGLLERARTAGAAVEVVGSHLIIECIDFIAVRERHREKEGVLAILDRAEPLMSKWKAEDDFIFPCEAHQRYAHAQNYAPVSIFPLEPKTCVRLMAGAISLVAFVNVSAVLRELETRGWRVVKSPFELAQSVEALEALGREVPIAVLQKGRLTTSVPAPLIGRLGMEFLKPKSLAQLLDATLEQRSEERYEFVNFEGESRMWK